MIQYGLFRIENAVISENMNKRRDRTVLAFRASEAVNSRRHFEGVFRYAREHGWNVHAFEYGGRQGDPLEWKDPESGLRTGLKELLDFWRPEGCVVDCGAVERPLPPEAFGRIPVVFLDLYGDGGHSAAAAISSDDKGIASVAACELLKLGCHDAVNVCHNLLFFNGEGRDDMHPVVAEDVRGAGEIRFARAVGLRIP